LVLRLRLRVASKQRLVAFEGDCCTRVQHRIVGGNQPLLGGWQRQTRRCLVSFLQS